MVGGFNYPYRAQKGSIHDGGMKTPSFIYAPFYFTETSQSVYDGLMHLVDWGPTLLSIVDQTSGIDFKHKMGDIDGIDLSQVLSTKDFASGPVRSDVILDANGWTNSTAFIYGDYKLVLGFSGGDLMWMEPVDEWTKYPKETPALKVPDRWNRFLVKCFAFKVTEYVDIMTTCCLCSDLFNLHLDPIIGFMNGVLLQ